MVIVRLNGGMGNQMFQYATARRLALVSNSPLKLDLSWFANIPPEDTRRQYELHDFNSVQDVASPGEVKALQGVDIARWPKAVKRLLKCTGLLIKQTCVREKNYHFNPEILHLSGDIYLDGCWQSAKYFADVKETICQDFSLRLAPDPVNACLAETIQGVEAVSVHVRRGDYVADKKTGQYHGVSPLEYYRSAITEITARIANPHYFVFSDEPEWAKSNLRVDAPMVYIEHNGPEKGYEDLRLMSLCRHHIIANSSFSWWGAWLSRNPGKIVIAPQKWFNRDDINTDDLIPEGWLRL
jgi:hypothetical protein